MMSNNFSPRKNLKTVWRNIAVALFAVCFALLGLCVTLIPSRATDDGVKKLGTIALGYFPQTYVGAELNQTLQGLNDQALTGKNWSVHIDNAWFTAPEYEFNEQLYAKVSSAKLKTGETNQFSTGEGVVDGQTYFFKVEPIIWDLVQDGDQVVAIVHTALGSMPFGPSTSTWPISTMRQYLIDQFATESGLDQYAIPYTYTEGGVELTDKFWVPSVSEVTKLLPTDAERAKLVTDFGIATFAAEFNDSPMEIMVLRTIDGEIAVNKIQINGRIYQTSPKTCSEDCPLIAFILDPEKIPLVLDDMTVEYDGTDQRIEQKDVKPDWYNAVYTLTYYQGATEVNTVQDAGDYTVRVGLGDFYREFTLTVAPREVTLSGTVTAENKPYDRGREATLNTAGVQVNGRVDGDDLNFEYRGVFADKHVGADKLVTITTTMTGNDAKNYTLIDPQFTTSADITAKTVGIALGQIKVQVKEYDGTTNAVIATTGNPLSGKIAGDDLTVIINGEYTQTTVGENLPVKLSLTLVGDDAGNYKIPAGDRELTGNITQRLITVTVNNQTVKVGDPLTLTARVTSGSLANGDNADDVYTLAIKPTDPDVDVDHLPVGEYEITGKGINDNYDIDFVDGKYTVLTPEAWEALQITEDKDGNNAWLIIVIVIAIAAFVGALVGVGLVIRSHDKNRDPKPTKEKKVRTEKGAKQPDAVGNQK